MPGFRGGVFASCVLYLFCLRLPLPYLSIGDLIKRRSCHSFPVSIPSSSFVFGTCIAGVLSVPFWASSPSLSYVAFSCASSVSSLTFFSPHPVLCHSCQTMPTPCFASRMTLLPAGLPFRGCFIVCLLLHHLLPLASLTLPWNSTFIFTLTIPCHMPLFPAPLPLRPTLPFVPLDVSTRGCVLKERFKSLLNNGGRSGIGHESDAPHRSRTCWPIPLPFPSSSITSTMNMISLPQKTKKV